MLAINPRNAAALNYYGYMLAERGVRLDEAIGLVQRALAEDPRNASYLDSIGWAYLQTGQICGSRKVSAHGREGEPHNPTMLTHLGDMLPRAGAAIWRRPSGKNRSSSGITLWPASMTPRKVSDLEQKISSLKRRLAKQQKPGESQPQ